MAEQLVDVGVTVDPGDDVGEAQQQGLHFRPEHARAGFAGASEGSSMVPIVWWLNRMNSWSRVFWVTTWPDPSRYLLLPAMSCSSQPNCAWSSEPLAPPPWFTVSSTVNLMARLPKT